MALINDKTAFVEALKELGRLVLIAAVSAALAGASSVIGLLDPTTAAIAGIVLSVLVKAWGTYLHKSDANNITTGLTGF